MTPPSVNDLSAALEEVLAEIERTRDQLQMAARIIRATKLKMLELEGQRSRGELRISFLEQRLRETGRPSP